MPNARSANRIKAEHMYLDANGDIKIVDIADDIGENSSKVRKWKSLDKWDEKLQPPHTATQKKQVDRSACNKGNAPPKNAPQVERKKGGQPGNKNAIGDGGGAPERNKNAWKHGAYSKVIAGCLDEEENVIFERPFEGEESELIEQLRLLDVSIVRKLKVIQQYWGLPDLPNMPGGLAISSVVTTKVSKKTTTTTTTESTVSAIQRIEKELLRVQRAKAQIIAQLTKLRLENSENEYIDNLIYGRDNK